MSMTKLRSLVSTTDALGHAKRSSHQENLLASGRLGAFVVKSPKYEKTFKVSAGSMCMEERRATWVTRELILGKMLRFKYFPHGMKDVPRHPLFAGYRDPKDMS